MSSDLATCCRDAVHDQFEALRPVSMEYLGEGCDSVAFEVNGAFVFRFPKRTDVEQQFSIEARILPALARTSPLPLPRFEFFGKPTESFPRHFVGYRKLTGRSALAVDSEEAPPIHLAATIGAFLSWLHAQPIADAESLGVPRQSLATVIEEIRNDALDDLDLAARVAPQLPVAALRHYFRHPPHTPPTPPVLVHNDFAAEHVLVDDSARTVTGVIDWSDVAISDSAADFAGVFHWGGDRLAEAVLVAHGGGVDDGLRRRAKFMAVCRGVMDIAFGHELGRSEYVEAGLRAVRLCHNPRDLGAQ